MCTLRLAASGVLLWFLLCGSLLLAQVPSVTSADKLDLYCERTSDAFWAEPVNALTNLSFIAAAAAAWMYAGREGKCAWQIGVLALLAFSVGVGSFLFHTLATRTASWLDLIPIFAFQLWFLWLYLRHVARVRVDAAAAGVTVFFVAMFGAKYVLPEAPLNGSLLYLPALVMLLALGVYQARTQSRGRWLLLAATGVFTVALVFRSLDMQVCPRFPLGTHFLWHAINGVLVYLSQHVLIVCGRYNEVVARR